MTPTNATEFDDLLETSIDHQKRRRNKCPRHRQKVLSGAKGVNTNYKDRKNSAFLIQLESYDFKLGGTRATAALFTNPGDNSFSGQKKTVGLTRWMPLLPKDPSNGNSGALKMDADRKQSLEICIVCGDKASGRHYGAISCEGCKGFFKRSIRKMLAYSCRGNKDCEVTKHHRNRCQYCRLQKCLTMGMRSDSVQSERKPLENREKYKSSSGLSGDTRFMDYGSSSTTNQKTFSRKDICVPHTGVSSFIGEKSRTAALLNAKLLENMANMPNTDFALDTLATLATMGKRNEGRNGRVSASSPSPDDGDTASGGESDCGSELKEKTLFSRAFDTMAKAVQSHNAHIQDSNYGADGLGYNSDQDDSNTSFEMDGSLILDNHVPFNLNAPSPMPTYLNVHYICESASRLLFLSVHWARSIPAFQLLTTEVQIGLIRGAWCELFALGLAQCSQVMNLSTILAAIVSHLHNNVQEDKLTPARVRQITEHICKLQDYLGIMLRLQLDDHEYAYLKAIVLFSPDHLSTNNSRQVEKFQSKITRELRLYIEQTFPDNHDRFAKLLLRFPTLRSLQSNIMEELFFAGLIGNVQIENIIPFILRMEASDYTPNLDISPSDSMEVNTGLRT